jgi:hypothetical protein
LLGLRELFSNHTATCLTTRLLEVSEETVALPSGHIVVRIGDVAYAMFPILWSVNALNDWQVGHTCS